MVTKIIQKVLEVVTLLVFKEKTKRSLSVVVDTF